MAGAWDAKNGDSVGVDEEGFGGCEVVCEVYGGEVGDGGGGLRGGAGEGFMVFRADVFLFMGCFHFEMGLELVISEFF